MGSETAPRVIKLPRQRLRKLATTLLNLHPIHASPLASPTTTTPSIRIVCISDTHNTQPRLPDGDVLIHAGDLTENGSFDEVQAQVSWISCQPHRYKVVVAGNHDVLLDEAFLKKYPGRRYGQTKTLHDLDWGKVHYLQDTSVTLDFANDNQTDESQGRRLTFYGSPMTPQYGISAFQFPREQDVWENRIPSNTDVVITHGPPHLHLDARDFHRAGCPFLAQEVARVRPRLVVFGHIHASYGRENLVVDKVRRAYEEIVGNWAGREALLWMVWGVILARLETLFHGREKMLKKQRITTFVNAAVVGGRKNQLRNLPSVVEL